MRSFFKGLLIYFFSVAVLSGALLLSEYAFFGGSKYLTVKRAVIIAFVIALLLWLVIKYLIKHFREMSYLRSPLSKIDKMSGEEFELYLKAFFEKNGYKVTLTPASNDYGADLILEKKDETTVVQAKRYDGKVGTAAVQEVVAARDYYEASGCIVVTNSFFTKNAQGLAEANEVTLWDRDIVSKMGK